MIASALIVDWLRFVPAVLLLLTPFELFYDPKKIRHRELSRDWDEHWPMVLAHGQHAIDLGRAALGTWLLLDSLQSVPNPHGLAKYAVLLTQGSIRIFAVWLATVVCRERDAVNAPFAFVAGLLLAGSSPLVAVFALAFAIPLAAGMRYPGVFFPLLGLAHLGIGAWFKGKGAVLTLSFGATAAMIPWLWSLLFHRELVVAYRAKRLSENHQHDPLR